MKLNLVIVISWYNMLENQLAENLHREEEAVGVEAVDLVAEEVVLTTVVAEVDLVIAVVAVEVAVEVITTEVVVVEEANVAVMEVVKGVVTIKVDTTREVMVATTKEEVMTKVVAMEEDTIKVIAKVVTIKVAVMDSKLVATKIKAEVTGTEWSQMPHNERSLLLSAWPGLNKVYKRMKEILFISLWSE